MLSPPLSSFAHSQLKAELGPPGLKLGFPRESIRITRQLQRATAGHGLLPESVATDFAPALPISLLSPPAKGKYTQAIKDCAWR